jgi:hypothetical protein
MAWAFGGHGVEDTKGTIKMENGYIYQDFMARNAIHHKLYKVILYSCWAGQGNWISIVSPYGALHASKDSYRPAITPWEALPVMSGWENSESGN